MYSFIAIVLMRYNTEMTTSFALLTVAPITYNLTVIKLIACLKAFNQAHLNLMKGSPVAPLGLHV